MMVIIRRKPQSLMPVMVKDVNVSKQKLITNDRFPDTKELRMTIGN